MRGLFLFGRRSTRNDPVRLVDPHPVEQYPDDLETGDAGKDGMTVLSKADAQAQGSPPPVPGVIGPAYNGPDQSFEQ